jgi:AcrR family transcriptional regulator
MARPRRIDRSAVLRESLALADEAGIEAITMQAVADRLGVTPMALYRHVTNKADLLDGVVESLLDEVPDPAEDRAWDDQLAAMAGALRSTARRHPSVFPLLLQRPASTPAARRARDRVCVALRDAGVNPREIPRLERVVSTMVLGFAASEAGGRFSAHSRKVLDADFAALLAVIRAGLATYLAPDDD